ncbi:MAG TPA: PAS domain-containing protein [Caulobacteraceae bacterium]
MDDYAKSVRAGASLAAKHDLDDPFVAAIKATRMSMIVTDARDRDNPIIFANDAFLGLTGYERQEVIGRNCRFLQGVHTEDADIQAIGRAVREGRDIARDILNYRKDGTPFWNALYVSPVRNEAGEIVYFFGSQIDITDKKKAELQVLESRKDLEAAVAARTADLSRALEQKTALLHEVDHRVKNNLQLISSLLLLQARRNEKPEVKLALKSMLERVNAVATVHRRLFQAEDVQRFDVAEFVRDLVSDAVGASGRADVVVRLNLERVDVAASKAAPLALVINELLCNALHHAFPGGRTGHIDIGIVRENGDFRIEIADDGVGMNAAGKDQPPCFGLNIVRLLCQQLRASIDTDSSHGGVRTIVRLPINGVH